MSKTTIAGIVIVIAWLSAVAVVYTGTATFEEASQAFIAVLTIATGFGLWKAKDDKPNTRQ